MNRDISSERIMNKRTVADFLPVIAGRLWVAMFVFCVMFAVAVTHEKTAYAQEYTSDVSQEAAWGYVDLSGHNLDDKGETVPSASLAGTVDADLENRILNAMTHFEALLSVSGSGLTYDNYNSYIANLMGCHPELCYVNGISYLYYVNTGEITQIKITYCDDARTVKAALDEAIQQVETFVDTVGMRDVEKVLAYHEYLTSTVAYAYDDYMNDALGSKHEYDMYGTLVNKSAVCQGYAETMMYFMIEEGIPCAIASSSNINHAWNIVRIGGKWYHIDVTWDDPVRDIPGRSYHNYFLISTDTLNQYTESTQGSDRSDMVIKAQWGGTYTSATDKTYERGQLWTGMKKNLFYRDGYWYAIGEGSNIFEYQIYSYSYASHTKNIIHTGEAYWRAGGSGGVYTGQYGSIYISGDNLYFTTPRAVCSINLADADYPVTDVAAASDEYDTGCNIYVLGIKNGRLIYGVADTPYPASYDEFALDVCVSHIWDSGVVTKQPTESYTGILEYTCIKCGAKTKTEIPKLVVTVPSNPVTLAKVMVKTANTQGGVKLSWNKVSGGDGYRIYRKSGSGSYALLAKVTGSSTAAFTDSKVKSGTTYTYKVIAYKGGVTGTGTESIRCFIGCAKTRTANMSTGVKIAWNKVGGATMYKLYRKTGTGKYICIKNISAGTLTYTDKTAKSGSRYAYVIKPCKGQTVGTYVKSVIVHMKPPAVAAAAKKTGIAIRWSKTAAAKGYRIYRKTPSGKWTLVRNITGGSTLTWTDTKAKKGQTYYYTVRAVRDSCMSAAAAAKKAKR